MKLLLKLGALLALTGMTSTALGATCVGKTYSGTQVTVHLNSVGTMAFLQDVTVIIDSKNGELINTYSFSGDRANQFYEASKDDDMTEIVVGMQSYTENGYPLVHIDYIGGNYIEHIWADLDRDHKEDLSRMKVWKGPGHDESEHYTFKDVACELEFDP